MTPNLDQERVERAADAIEHALFGEPAADLSEVAKAAITAYLGDTHVVVPKEPTDEMYIAGYAVTRDAGYGHCHDAVGGAVYRAMLSATPTVNGKGE